MLTDGKNWNKINLQKIKVRYEDMRSFYQYKSGKMGEFTLRENTYRRMWYLIADYPYFKAVAEGEIDIKELNWERQSVTEEKAISLCNFGNYIEAIENAKQAIPELYIEDVMNHIINNVRYKELTSASDATLKKWVQRFIWRVAKELGEI
jgi:hypothetical protein